MLLLLASIFIILAHLCSASRLGGYDPKLGTWTPVKNTSDPHIVEIGEFAVSAYNRITNSKLEFCRVIKGETMQIVVVNLYKLVIEAKDGDKVGNYEAIVWEKAWKKLGRLVNFKPV